MITYADIEKTFRMEKSSPSLSKISEEFFDDAKRLSNDPQAGEYGPLIEEVLLQLYRLRINKIVHHAGRELEDKYPPKNITKSEEKLFKDLLQAISKHQNDVFSKVLEKKVEVREDLVRIRIKKPFPSIVGADSKEYGPFREEDMIEIPSESAQLLIERDVAEKA